MAKSLLMSLMAVTYTSDFEPALIKEFYGIHAIIECGLTLDHLCIMIKTYNHITIFLPLWLRGDLFVDELNGCGFESSVIQSYFRFRVCFEQGIPWHSDNYRVWISSESHA